MIGGIAGNLLGSPALTFDLDICYDRRSSRAKGHRCVPPCGTRRYHHATMAGLLIKEVPKDLHRKLKARAAANRRSLSSEVLTILESALHDRSAPLTLAEVDRLRTSGRRPLTQAILERARKRNR